jgi:hypothetical protein
MQQVPPLQIAKEGWLYPRGKVRLCGQRVSCVGVALGCLVPAA